MSLSHAPYISQMNQWKKKATTLGRKLQRLRKKYSEEKEYGRSLEGTIYSLQDQLEEQKQKSTSQIDEIQQEYDKLQLILRQQKETMESLHREQGIKTTLILKLERDAKSHLTLINSLRNELEKHRRPWMIMNNVQYDVINQMNHEMRDKMDQIDLLKDEIMDWRVKWQSERDQCKLLQKARVTTSDDSGSNKPTYWIITNQDTTRNQHTENTSNSNSSDARNSPPPNQQRSPAHHMELVYRRGHESERRYHCHYCSMTFRNKSHLTRHLRVHTGERPYQCLICKKAFKSKGCLTGHMRTHSDERPFTCMICKRGFKKKYALTSHMKKLHSDERPFECSICHKRFRFKVELTVHQSGLHNV